VGAHGRRDRKRLRSPDHFGRGGARPRPALRQPMSAVLRPADALREQVAAGRDALRREYLQKPEPRVLLQRHSHLIDRIVKEVWSQIEPARSATLVATGGYARGELSPYSDIDLLVLLPAEPDAAGRERVER